ncbi:MAG: substrate-binding domain-containing protein [Oscillospiraceae bacterium]|nr:substrate-binding domain-containing protein [Oscillospiraceae bacterium]
MRKSRTILICALILFCAFLCCGCSVTSQQSPGSGPYKVYLIVKSTDTEFWLSAIAGANAAKAEYNIDLVIVGPETEEEYEQQNEFIEQAIRDDADAIVFSAISYTGNADTIDKAADAGIKIIVIDSDVDSSNVNVRIGTDNLQAGRMTGNAVMNADLEDFVVGIVNFDKESRNGQEREMGLREVLESDSRVSGIYTINVSTDAEAARIGAELLLNEHPEINVLVGLNEPLAVGVGKATRVRELGGKVKVVGFDTNVQCVDMMRDGIVTALIAQNPYAMGYLGVESAWKLLEGETYNSEQWIDTATTIVDKENMFSQESQRMLFSFG